MEFREKISKYSYLRIKAEIKGRAAMGKALREEAGRNRGDVRSYLRQMKTSHAIRTRLLLLSLALLKGRKYRDVERNAKHVPDRDSLAKFMLANVCTSFEYRKIINDEIAAFFAEAATEAAA